MWATCDRTLVSVRRWPRPSCPNRSPRPSPCAVPSRYYTVPRPRLSRPRSRCTPSRAAAAAQRRIAQGRRRRRRRAGRSRSFLAPSSPAARCAGWDRRASRPPSSQPAACPQPQGRSCLGRGRCGRCRAFCVSPSSCSWPRSQVPAPPAPSQGCKVGLRNTLP